VLARPRAVEMSCLVLLLLFPFVTVPSIIYGLSAYLLLPLAFILSIFTGRPSPLRASSISVWLVPIFLVVVVPVGLYFLWWPLAIIFAAWMLLYLVGRRFSGVSERQRYTLEGWRQADVGLRSMKNGRPRPK